MNLPTIGVACTLTIFMVEAAGATPMHTLAAAAHAAPKSALPIAPARSESNVASVPWPPGTVVLPIEDLDGLLLLQSRLRGGANRDTSGLLALDTGAGYLALDRGLAFTLGIVNRKDKIEEIAIADEPLARLGIGTLDQDQVSPVLTIDAEIIRRVSDRPVLGLLGQRPLAQRAVWIDYSLECLALIPVAGDVESKGDGDSADTLGARSRRVLASRAALDPVLTPAARAVPFELAGDGKLLVRAWLSNPSNPSSRPLTLILDTGATKCVLFEDSLARFEPQWRDWPALRGLSAPTLIGTSDARIAMVPMIQLESDRPAVQLRHVDVAVMRSQLSEMLTRVAGIPVHGLLGASFLRRYRITIDYPHRVLWLEPPGSRRGERPWEYCHVGIQLERWEGRLRVVAVATGSPAARAGIRIGDDFAAIDGKDVANLDVTTVSRRLEGAPGTKISISLRRDGVERRYRLIRRRLL